MGSTDHYEGGYLRDLIQIVIFPLPIPALIESLSCVARKPGGMANDLYHLIQTVTFQSDSFGMGFEPFPSPC